MDHAFYHILGAACDEPSAMPLDTRGPLAKTSFEEAVQRVRRALQKHVAPLDTYVRAVRQVPVTEDNPSGREAYAKVTNNPKRWACGEEGAQAALSMLGPERIVHIIQGTPLARKQVVQFVGHQLAPRLDGPDTPYLGPQAPRRTGPGPTTPR